MKRTLSLLLFSGILVFLIFFPQQSLSYAKTGLMLWFYTLLPSMLPFIILSNFFIQTNALDKLLAAPKKIWHSVFGLSPNGTYALFMGIFCGYPMGAKITADLYREQRISYQEACYLLSFSNHPGPSFLSAYLCVSIFKRPDLIFPTYLIIYTSSFLCSLFFRFQGAPGITSNTICSNKKETSCAPSLGELLDVSIMNGFQSITKLGGYIILFSIIQGILKQMLLPVGPVKYLILGLTEITTGTAALSESTLPFTTCYPLALAFTSFGGLCVTAQTKSMLAGTNLPFKSYLKGKLCCALCTLILAGLIV